MALELFKPTLWSNRFINNMDKALVFRQVVDTSYAGEIQFGQVLKINEIGDILISDYSSTGGLTWQDVDDAQREMVIDQKKSFSFAVDDVDAVQMNVSVMDASMKRAAFNMADTIDQFIAGKYTEAGITDTTNLGSASSVLSLYANDMPDLITYMHRYLKENSAMGRPWCVAPPWFMQLLRYAQITNGTNTFDTPNSPALEGVATGMGFDWYESNNVSNDGTDFRIMFGTGDAIAYAGQVEKVEAIRREDYFSDGVRGLYIYGSKVVRPDHLGVIHSQFSGLTS
jgi:hypothetical protein